MLPIQADGSVQGQREDFQLPKRARYENY